MDHIDEDKTNNVVTNLRYLPKNINVRPRKYKEPLFGKTSKRYKGKIEVYDLITGEVLITLRGSAEMRKEGYDPRNVSAVVLGKRGSYLGRGFRRVDDTLPINTAIKTVDKCDVPFIEVYDDFGKYLYTFKSFKDLVSKGFVLQRIHQFFSGKVKHHRGFTFKINREDVRIYNDSNK